MPLNYASLSSGARLAALALGALVAACESEPPESALTFDEPTGMVVAGTGGEERLFVANRGEDTLQAIELSATLSELKLQASEAVHFALRIEAGPNPRDLAATMDRRFIVVLNGSGETLRLVDANAKVPVTDNGAVVQLGLGPGSAPSALVTAPKFGDTPAPLRCDAPCLGRFYVALSGAGIVRAVEVREEGPTRSLAAVRDYDVGGAPAALAVSPDGRWLFAADGASTEVVQLDLDAGVTTPIDVGATPGALAVSSDNQLLVVARPVWRDLVLVSNIGSAAPTFFDANPAFAPFSPQSCVASCDAPGSCVGAHPADLAMCSTGQGLATGPDGDYRAIYVDIVPARLLAVGASGPGGATLPSGGSLSLSCGSTRTYSQFAVVAGLEGQVRFVGLVRSDEGGPGTPELVDAKFCEAPTVQAVPKSTGATVLDPALTTYLGACPPAPARARFACAGASDSGRVLLLPGRTGKQRWMFEWEGLLVSEGTGATVRDYRQPGPGEAAFVLLVDRDLAAAGVQAGDALVIGSAPGPECAVQADTDSVADCGLEWRIARLAASVCLKPEGCAPGEEEGPAVILRAASGAPQTTITQSCFPANAVRYRVRAGDSHLVKVGAASVRVRSGETVGLGTSLASSSTVTFAFVPPLPAGLSPVACERYNADGKLRSAPDTEAEMLFARDHTFGFDASDTFQPLNIEASLSGTTTVPGFIPGAMLLVETPNVVAISYTGDNRVFVFKPFAAAEFTKSESSRLLH